MLYITTCVYSMAGVPLTTSNVLAVVREVERWWGIVEGIGSLTSCLCIPESKEKEIMANFPDEMDQKQQAISYWINTDPLASWRRLVIALDGVEETELADSIRSNFEPLTGMCVHSNKHVWLANHDQRSLQINWGAFTHAAHAPQRACYHCTCAIKDIIYVLCLHSRAYINYRLWQWRKHAEICIV